MGRVGGGSNNNQFTSRDEGRDGTGTDTGTRHRNRHSACAPIQPDGHGPSGREGSDGLAGLEGLEDGMEGLDSMGWTG